VKLLETASLARYSSAMRAVMLCQHEFVAVTAGNGTEPADVAFAKVTERRHSLSRCRSRCARALPAVDAMDQGAQ
jgi:hypothetical protein